MSRLKRKEERLEHRSAMAGLMVVIVAAVTLEATSLIQTYFSGQSLKKEASLRAQTQLESTKASIMDVVNQTESAVRNSIWISEWCLKFQDSLANVPLRLVHDNPVVMGSTVALVPGYSRRYPLLAPYTYRSGDALVQRSLATEAYDYPSQEWFTEPVKLDQGYWSEPYFDEGGGEVLMTTYSVPIHDMDGQTAGVLTADIALDWLTDMMADIKIYPHANSVMISRTGSFMVSKSRELLQSTLIDVVDDVRNHEDFMQLDRAMKSGQSGKVILKYKGDKFHVFYAPIEHTGWAMCIIVPSDDIYGSLRKVGTVVLLLQLIGLALLIIILNSFVRGQLKFNELNKKRERMQGELQIASGIQMSMVPKVFPPFPERDDLDMSADIIPAKEVGGDLYDFFMRDEKLFFCIGDVSGKGIPASLVMAVTRTTFRNLSAHEDSPGRIVSAMNDSLSAMNESNMFVTFFCGVLDMTNGILRYCNAGHNPPLVLTDEIRTLAVEPNLPLGIMAGFEFTEQEMPFSYDDSVFLYTDGLTEAENAEHEQFGEERMMDSLHGRKDAASHLKEVEENVAMFVNEAPQSDDLTMLFIHYLGKSGASVYGPILVMHNNVKQIERLGEWVNHIASENGIAPDVAMSINLALEEAATNVIMYAYPDGTYGSVEIEAIRSGKQLTFILADSGKPFDPTAKPEVDITAGLEERGIGGLGIHLVRTIMDEVRYDRKEGKNILTMIKHI